MDVITGRPGRAPGVKFKDADLVGIPFRVRSARGLPKVLWRSFTLDTRNTM